MLGALLRAAARHYRARLACNCSDPPPGPLASRALPGAATGDAAQGVVALLRKPRNESRQSVRSRLKLSYPPRRPDRLVMGVMMLMMLILGVLIFLLGVVVGVALMYVAEHPQR